MKNSKIRRALFIVPVLLILGFFYVVSTQKQMERINREFGTPVMLQDGFTMQVAVSHQDVKKGMRWFHPGKPYHVTRETRGKGMTTIKTAAYILNPGTASPSLKHTPAKNLCGIVYLMDLSDLPIQKGGTIPKEALQKKLEAVNMPITMLALRTRASDMPPDYGFTAKNFMALAPETAQLIHDYKAKKNHQQKPSRIFTLLLDLPAIDRDDAAESTDSTETHPAGRRFFGLAADGEKKIRPRRLLVESAYFAGLPEGYYYASIIPTAMDTASAGVGIFFHPLSEIEKDEE